jgi:hypothetical protein
MGRASFLLQWLVCALTGCSSLLCPDSCNSDPTPVKGTGAMFSLGGVEGDGYRVGDLTGCGTQPEHFVAVTGTGDKYAGIPLDGGCRPVSGTNATSDCSVTVEILIAAISSRLEERGVADSLTGIGNVCASENVSGVYVEIDDYGRSDAATEAIGDVLKDEGLADSVYLVIRAKRIACAQLGCGW